MSSAHVPAGTMRIRIAVMLLLAAAAMAALALLAGGIFARDRQQLIERFAAERAHQLEEARAEIESDFEGLRDDLRLAARLATTADSRADLERELTALVAVVSKYEAIAIHDGRDGQVTHLIDRETDPDGTITAAIEQASTAAAGHPGTLYSSRPIQTGGDALRVFSLAPPGSSFIVATIVVDTTPLLSRLRIVAAAPDSKLLILGAHDSPSPASDPVLRSLVPELLSTPSESSALASLLRKLRARDSGMLHIPATEAERIGLANEPAIAIFRPIRIPDGDSWSVALLASTSAIAVSERALTRRLVTVVILFAFILAALSGFAILMIRRTISLRERLRRAGEVAHLHEKADKVLDTIPTGVIVLDEADSISTVNAVLRGRLPPDSAGKSLAQAFRDADPEVIDRLDALVQAAKKTGSSRSLCAESCRLFESEGSYNLHAVPLAARSADAALLVVIEDLGLVGTLERQLLRSEKLATVGVLAAGIAHEIGTPLSVVRGRAEYALNKLDPTETAAEHHRIIIDQIDHVSRTIRRLLDFARARPSETIHEVDLAASVGGVAELLKLEAESRGLSLRTDIGPEVPPLAADPDQLEQALVNLLMNAFDACSSGGTVRITAEARRGAVIISVADDGRGIDEHLRSRVFDPFFTTKKRGKGTGLGLAIVAQIVKGHGGTIELESEPDRGTCVKLSWPVSSPRDVRNVSAN